MLLNNSEQLREIGKKGDWSFSDGEAAISIMYTDDWFMGTVVLPISGKNCWQWNGNKEFPTLTPSILIYGDPGWSIGWHGYLTDGKLVDV